MKLSNAGTIFNMFLFKNEKLEIVFDRPSNNLGTKFPANIWLNCVVRPWKFVQRSWKYAARPWKRVAKAIYDFQVILQCSSRNKRINWHWADHTPPPLFLIITVHKGSFLSWSTENLYSLKSSRSMLIASSCPAKLRVLLLNSF